MLLIHLGSYPIFPDICQNIFLLPLAMDQPISRSSAVTFSDEFICVPLKKKLIISSTDQ